MVSHLSKLPECYLHLINATFKASIKLLEFCSRAVVNAMDDGPGIENEVGLGEGAVVRDRKIAFREARSSFTKSLFRFVVVVGLRVDELVASISLKLKIRYN